MILLNRTRRFVAELINIIHFQKMAARVEIHEEIEDGPPGDWRLCFHRVTYHYNDGSPDEEGYRFMWRRPDGSLQAARGQARIPDLAALNRLTQRAITAGWLV